MAKKSWIARNARKKETVEKYAALRLKLKAEKDYVGLSMLENIGLTVNEKNAQRLNVPSYPHMIKWLRA